MADRSPTENQDVVNRSAGGADEPMPAVEVKTEGSAPGAVSRRGFLRLGALAGVAGAAAAGASVAGTALLSPPPPAPRIPGRASSTRRPSPSSRP